MAGLGLIVVKAAPAQGPPPAIGSSINPNQCFVAWTNL